MKNFEELCSVCLFFFTSKITKTERLEEKI